jgi:hypothetical protein
MPKKDERPKITVRATAVGFYGGARRRKGDVFSVPEGVVGKWFVPTDASLAEKNNLALEEAAKAKKEAEETNRAAKIQADKDALEIKKKADADLVNAKKVADDQAKKSIFGGLLGKKEVKPGEGATDPDLDGVA